jgi:predicted RND superfamily exporter protein
MNTSRRKSGSHDAMHTPSWLQALFRFIVARRWWWVILYAFLLGPSAYFALKVPIDSSIDQLIVRSDPDYIRAKEFEKVFGQGEFAVIVAEAPDPYAPEVLRRMDALQAELGRLSRVQTDSIISVYRRAKARFEPTREEAEALRRFATGTDLFRRQGLLGEHHLTIALILDIDQPKRRHEILTEVDRVVEHLEKDPGPITAVRKVGVSYVNSQLDSEIDSGMRYFPFFVALVVLLNLFLYRSWRALAAFLITLAVSAALTVGFIGLIGGIFTIVSSLVPMTVLITCTATLVYLHSRYVERPAGVSIEQHQIFALCNKFLPATASVFATAVGFAALAVSKIRPVREVGIWVAIGLVFTWLVVFTLFPALQRILKAPTGQERKVSGSGWFLRLVDVLPRWTYRWRWLLVSGSIALCGVGAVTLFGIPGVLAPMHLETNPLEYFNQSSRLYRDTHRVAQLGPGQSMSEIWLKSSSLGLMTDPEVLRGLGRYAEALEKEKGIGAVIGVPQVVRMLRYIGGQGDRMPEDESALEAAAAQIEALAPSEPTLGRFLDKSFSQTHLVLLSHTADYKGFVALEKVIRERWQEAVAAEPALGKIELSITGLGPLEAKIAYHLVPTLVESFVLSVVIIYAAFLFIFRNWAARLMAIIPSLFAILVMFALMRAFGMTLNVATILIASTVLGTSENDQIHFFYHFLERSEVSTEEGLRHALLIAGRAILFATLINAGGFLAFALSDLPPIRQFGTLSSIAFLLSMVADFTALPAALWIVFRARPDAAEDVTASGKAKGEFDHVGA